ncbi:hypothetical protein EGC79_11110 [Shewanella vesiculosa]|jgi:hypothetical protein|uniref:hypothetical protein n=1 Tax=Shewanella vesiculosa TaxID=518738 RepID=UPI000F4DEA57|nr:hypothetical protein [Shewanella vesiculosa]RPA50632.1 hypothetical protein EGC79_11110 [Shewanella vesiculosa]UJL44366.1 hypothetical protein KDH10_001862 [Shewanella vesiculosa]
MANSTVQFDLTNPQHVAMRKLMADIYARHVEAHSQGLPLMALRYLGMAQGLEKVALYVLADHTLTQLCFELTCSLHGMDSIARIEVAA